MNLNFWKRKNSDASEDDKEDEVPQKRMFTQINKCSWRITISGNHIFSDHDCCTFEEWLEKSPTEMELRYDTEASALLRLIQCVARHQIEERRRRVRKPDPDDLERAVGYLLSTGASINMPNGFDLMTPEQKDEYRKLEALRKAYGDPTARGERSMA